MSRNGHGQSASRVVGYRYHAREDYGFDPVLEQIERLLSSALANGVVTQFDTGRGTDFWFNGCPGPELRAVRHQIDLLVEGKVARKNVGGRR